MLEDLFDHDWIFDARSHLDRAAAVRAGFIGDIPVPDRGAAACGCANRQSCRFVMARLAALVPTPRVNLTSRATTE